MILNFPSLRGCLYTILRQTSGVVREKGVVLESAETKIQQMSRRGFIKLGTAAGVLYTSLGVFGGCNMFTDKDELISFDGSVLEDVRAGDIISLGTIVFTDNWGGRFSKNIEWRVLALEDKSVLVMTKNVIDLRPYNGNVTVTSQWPWTRGLIIEWEEEATSWEESNIRDWLNSVFFSGLSEEMKESAISYHAGVFSDQEKEILSGSNAKDKVFLLSIDEANRYFSSDRDRQSGFDCTAKAIGGAKRKWREDVTEKDGGADWWLRNTIKSESEKQKAVYVNQGIISKKGQYVGYDNIGIRPALWLSR